MANILNQNMTKENGQTSRYISIGMLAHVDAGKTTLSECVLYNSGAIGKQGRVDHGDAFLDNHELERRRGIKVFAKQAVFETKNRTFTIIDTPGHSDFSEEMKRSLKVLDYAVLIISAPDGVTGRVMNLWKLTEKFDIPTLIFTAGNRYISSKKYSFPLSRISL